MNLKRHILICKNMEIMNSQTLFLSTCVVATIKFGFTKKIDI